MIRHRESPRDGGQVYNDGEWVEDGSTQPAGAVGGRRA